MTIDFPLLEGTKNGDTAPSTAASAAGADLDKETVIAALDLLAHWWSRPVADEVSIWPSAADLEERLCSLMSDSAERLSWVLHEPLMLLDEHERLFVGPGPVPCPPYESFWREDVPVDIRRSLMGPCTADLRHIYHELGLELTPTSGELPDHVAVELEALVYGLSLEGTEPAARSLFFDHVRKWLPRLCRAVAHEAEQPFYRDLAAVTLDWLGPLQRYFESLIASAPTTR